MKVSNRKTTFGEYDFRHIPIYSQHWVEGESESALGSIPSRQEIKESRGSLDLMVKTGAANFVGMPGARRCNTRFRISRRRDFASVRCVKAQQDPSRTGPR